MRRAVLALAASSTFALLCAQPRIARADATSEAKATQLFERGRALARDGRCPEAIPILLESVKVAEGVGPLLNLGLCYESTGRTFTAHRYFVRAEELAASRGDPRKTDAHERAAALEPKLSRLTVRAPSDAAAEPDLILKMDGEPLPRERWSSAQLVDPGVHVIEASSSKRRPPTVVRIAVAANADQVELVVPPLSSPTSSAPASGSPASSATTPDDPSRSSSTQRVIGWSVAGVGAGVLAIGGVFGVLAKSDHDSVVDRCPTYPTCDASLRSDLDDRNDSAHTNGTISTVAVIGGAALLIGGVVLLLTAPNAPSTRTAQARGR